MRWIGFLMIMLFFVAACNSTSQTQTKASPSTQIKKNNDSFALSGTALAAFEKYSDNRNFVDFKAFFVDPHGGAWGRAYAFDSVDKAVSVARAKCEKFGNACSIYAIGNVIVFDQSASEREAVISEYELRLPNADLLNLKASILNDVTIRENLSGKTITGETFGGQKFSAEITTGGRIYVRLLDRKLNFTRSDQGVWWVKDGHFCRKLSYLNAGMEDCVSLYKKGGKFAVVNQNKKLISEFTVLGDIGTVAKYSPPVAPRKSASESAAKQEPKPKGLSSKQYRILGVMTVYSELCAQFLGIGVGNTAFADIKDHYKSSADFNKGYDSLKNYLSYDQITGLSNCEDYQNKLTKLHKKISN
ncbi:hypothetical protein NBZ79_11970 [Sneathiella marina]|uniref:SPOR domain-containing protein n=1 Tax=Sneathiella marina TaxID=2950108 RepID=A0ABY4VZ73_9PROT|nr:hypothetical protein [Sneathiella marina]USG59894.1 hypothetical protein NBZ79_11970 [Sneathiella marina]